MRDLATVRRTLILLHSPTNLRPKTKYLRKYTRAITQRLAILSDDWGGGFLLFLF